jgi:hypothetical protein
MMAHGVLLGTGLFGGGSGGIRLLHFRMEEMLHRLLRLLRDG